MDFLPLLVALQQTPAPPGTLGGFVNFSVSLGDIMTLAGTITATVSAYVHLREKLAIMTTKIDPLWEEYLRTRRRTRE